MSATALADYRDTGARDDGLGGVTNVSSNLSGIELCVESGWNRQKKQTTEKPVRDASWHLRPPRKLVKYFNK
jgi:hypothetical protein